VRPFLKKFNRINQIQHIKENDMLPIERFPVGSLTQPPNLEFTYQLFSEIEFRSNLPIIIPVFEEQVDLIVDNAFPEVAEFRQRMDVEISRELATMVSVFHVRRGDVLVPVCVVYIGQKMKRKKNRNGTEFGSVAFYRMLTIRMSVAFKRLRSKRFEEALLILPGRFHPDNLKKGLYQEEREEEIFVRTVTTSALVSNGTLDQYQSRPDPRLRTLQFVHFGEQQSKKTLPHFFKRAVGSGISMGQAVVEARRFIMLPPNDKTPLRLVEHFLGKKLEPETFSTEKAWHGIRGHRFGTTVKASIVYGVKRLEAVGFGGIVGVGRGSQHEPCLLSLHYRPKNKKEKTKRIVLIGKGVVFDTGGVNIKIGMDNMHYDMSGAATIISIIKLAAEKNLQVEIVALFPFVDNAISSRATRPHSILTMFDGKTVEITDTDAEGRVILADAVCFSERHLKPDCTVTVATLTDMEEFGPDFLKLVVTDDDLEKKVRRASKSAHEKITLFPRVEDLSEVTPLLIGTLSDHKNDIPWHYQVAPFMFVWDFFQWEHTKWVHLDVAAVFEGDADDYGAGPGFGVRFLYEFVKQFATRH
jgi:leucyl aminopeptidase